MAERLPGRAVERGERCSNWQRSLEHPDGSWDAATREAYGCIREDSKSALWMHTPFSGLLS